MISGLNALCLCIEEGAALQLTLSLRLWTLQVWCMQRHSAISGLAASGFSWDRVFAAAAANAGKTTPPLDALDGRHQCVINCISVARARSVCRAGEAITSTVVREIQLQQKRRHNRIDRNELGKDSPHAYLQEIRLLETSCEAVLGTQRLDLNIVRHLVGDARLSRSSHH